MSLSADFTSDIPKYADSTSTGSRKTGAGNVFGMDDFYKLMAVQLQNQDMMNPVDDSQFAAQMAQMATIQAMDQMNQMTMTSYAFSFMGKEVIVSDEDDSGRSVSYTGPVEKVVLYNGSPQVFVNGKAYALSQVMEVITPVADSSINLFDLIDRQVAVQVVDEENSTKEETKYKLITGTVDKVTMYEGKKVVVVDGENYTPDQIVEVLPYSQSEAPAFIPPIEDLEEEEEMKPAPEVPPVDENPSADGTTGAEDNNEQTELPEYQGEQGTVPSVPQDPDKGMNEEQSQDQQSNTVEESAASSQTKEQSRQ